VGDIGFDEEGEVVLLLVVVWAWSLILLVGGVERRIEWRIGRMMTGSPL